MKKPKPNENPSKVVIVPKPPKETTDQSTTTSGQDVEENIPDEEKPVKETENPEA
ncbi:MAG: hypothetical protein IIU20_00090 [Bacteroidales bacterium]|jgi:hypothetical protein|nr:hypothetical protein [Bacteroidales bacterium]MBQ5410152.1 hypothetical protein [Bacteroidales bacterium]MEE3476659.1 hypothetical protein [Candidatus Cryptobacteroides sp.]